MTIMSDKTKLKPCPFCGGKAKLKLNFDAYLTVEVFKIYCVQCGIQTFYNWSRQQVFKKWNRRT